MSATVLAESKPVARKRHQCAGCEGTIEPGTRYYLQRNVYDGHLYLWKMHDSCVALYWAIHREAGLSEDDIVDPEEIREVIAGLFRRMAAVTEEADRD